MKLLRLIQAARRQPRHIRDNIAFSIAAGFTVVVAGLWLYQAPNPAQLMQGGQTEATADPQPMFSQIRDSISQQTASLKDAFGSISGEETVAATTSDADNTADTPAQFQLTEENRRFMASSSVAASATATSETRRVVRIATTSASSTPAP